MLFPKTQFIDQKMPAAHRDHTTTAKDSTSTLDRTGPRFAKLLQLVTPGDIVLCLNSETWSSKGCFCSPILSHLVVQGHENSKAPSKACNEWRLLFLNFRTRWIFVAIVVVCVTLQCEKKCWCRIPSLILANVSMYI